MATLSCDEVSTSCKENNTCWEGYNDQPFAYILSIPMIMALAVSQSLDGKKNCTSLSHYICDISKSGILKNYIPENANIFAFKKGTFHYCTITT